MGRLRLLAVGVVPLALGLISALPTQAAPGIANWCGYVPALGAACSTAHGHYRVTLPDGLELESHGPDAKQSMLADHGTVWWMGSSRDPVCATDFYQHMLYAYPADKPNRLEQVRDEVQTYLGMMNAVLTESSLASGGPTADYKVLCDEHGEARVDIFPAPASRSPSYSTDFDMVVAAARSAGFTSTFADYTIFLDDVHSTVCGVGSFKSDDRPGYGNLNNLGGGYALVYQDCWAGRTPMHENGHNQGAVQMLAPLSDLTGHCLESSDVMCYTTGRGLDLICPQVMYFDCGFNTYFDTAPEPGEWLESHWNIGSPENRFIVLGGPPA